MRAKYQEIQGENATCIDCNREDITTLCRGWGFDITGLAKTAIDSTASYADYHNRIGEGEVFSTTELNESGWIDDNIIEDELKQVINMFLTQWRSTTVTFYMSHQSMFFTSYFYTVYLFTHSCLRSQSTAYVSLAIL